MRLAPLLAAAVATAVAAQGQTSSGPRIPAPPPIRGTVTAHNGETFETRYYFDHNALRRAVRAGRSIVALTASGNLLRFDLATLAMTGESLVVGRATTLAADDEHHVLVGTEDGRIDRVEIGTWRRTPVGTGGGPIVWIGTSGGSVVAVAAPRRLEWWPGEPVKSYERRSRAEESNARTRGGVLIIEGTRTRRFGIGERKIGIARAAYGLDRETLWIGSDYGEFGGSLHRMDLRTGRITPFTFTGNVRGFAIVPGAAYAYGGVSHITSASGYVSRIGSEPPADVVRFSNDEPVDPARPLGPINHLVPTADGEGFWAVSDHEVFRVDKALQSWSRVGSLGGRSFAGAAYAIANTPTVNSLIIDADHPHDLVAAMGRDGLVRISQSGESRRAFDGQLEIEAIDIWPTSAGPLLLPNISRSPSAWTLGEQGWSGSFFENLESTRPEGWYQCAIAGDDGKGVVVFCEDGWSPGERAIFRVGRDRRTELLERWKDDTSSALWGWLLSPMGQAVDTEDGMLRVRDRGNWLTIGKNAMPPNFDMLPRSPQRRFSMLDRIDDVSYFHDNDLGYLVALTPQADGSWRLARVDGMGSRSAGIWDAVPDGDRWILTASHTGLYRLQLPRGRARRMASPNDRDVITTITRDRQGRLWAGGDGVYVSGDDGAHWTMVDLPMTSRGSAKRIRPNPTADRGVWISLGDRGFVIVQ